MARRGASSAGAGARKRSDRKADGRTGRGAGRRTEPLAEPVDGGLAELVPDRERPHAWTLTLDGAPQSHVDLDDPTDRKSVV